MGNLIMQKLFGGGGPLIEVETQGACSSECCDEIEIISSSSSEPHTHASAHESYNTIPPDIENVPCSVYQTPGGMRGMKL